MSMSGYNVTLHYSSIIIKTTSILYPAREAIPQSFSSQPGSLLTKSIEERGRVEEFWEI